MFAYEKKKKEEKIGTRDVIQRLPQRADARRKMAVNVLGYVHTGKPTTVAVSDNKYAITPMPKAEEADWETISNSVNSKSLVSGVPGAESPLENHAERKLLYHDPGSKDMGVSNTICETCWPEIKAKTGTIEHVADPAGVYQITPEYQELGKLPPPVITPTTRFSLT